MLSETPGQNQNPEDRDKQCCFHQLISHISIKNKQTNKYTLQTNKKTTHTNTDHWSQTTNPRHSTLTMPDFEHLTFFLAWIFKYINTSFINALHKKKKHQTKHHTTKAKQKETPTRHKPHQLSEHWCVSSNITIFVPTID